VLKNHAQPDGHDEAVHRAIKSESEQPTFCNESKRADKDHCSSERYEKIYARVDQEPRDHSSNHQKFAMRKIDNTGKPEDQRDPDPDEYGHAGDREAVHQLLDEYLHLSFGTID
jgi:hypothetical protein